MNLDKGMMDEMLGFYSILFYIIFKYRVNKAVDDKSELYHSMRVTHPLLSIITLSLWYCARVLSRSYSENPLVSTRFSIAVSSADCDFVVLHTLLINVKMLLVTSVLVFTSAESVITLWLSSMISRQSMMSPRVT